MLASDTAESLFPLQDPIGQNVGVGDDFYTVIGTTAPRTASAAIGGSLDARDYNRDAYVPLESLQTHVGDMVLKREAGGEFGGGDRRAVSDHGPRA